MRKESRMERKKGGEEKERTWLQRQEEKEKRVDEMENREIYWDRQIERGRDRERETDRQTDR